MVQYNGVAEFDRSMRYDVCIVGAGPAGLTIAGQFLGTRLKVLVIESGGIIPDGRGHELLRGEVADATLHAPPDRFRRRCLGGATRVWGGRCLPLDPIDFLARPWLGLTQPWPIKYEELVPYWRRSHGLCELGQFEYGGGGAVAGGIRRILEGLHADDIDDDLIERFSRPTDFGKAYGDSLRRSGNVSLLLNSTCIRINPSRDGRGISSMTVAQDTTSYLTVCARSFVLAAGGLEVPRLLLWAVRESGLRIGAAEQQIGRYYMCHLAGVVGRFAPTIGQRVARGYARTSHGVYCRRRFAITARAQEAAGIGNAIVRLHQTRIGDARHGSAAMSAIFFFRELLPFEYAVRLARGDTDSKDRQHLVNVLRDPWDVLQFGAEYLIRRRFARRKLPSIVWDCPSGELTLDVHAEQLPNRESRVVLGQQADRFGIPVVRVDWRYQPADVGTVGGTLRLLAQAVRAGGHGEVFYDEAGLEAELLRDGAYGGHHLGTARMSNSPEAGVVDRNCRVHGCHNLFVAGGAVFPSSGQANPTMTIVALALRLADHLKGSLAGGYLSEGCGGERGGRPPVHLNA